MTAAKVAVALISIAAVALHAYESFCLADRPSPGFFLWLLVPYAVAALFAWRFRWYLPVAIGMIAALSLDLLNHHDVFVAPTSSTAGLNMIFVPLWSALLIVPAVILLAQWCVRKLVGARRAL